MKKKKDASFEGIAKWYYTEHGDQIMKILPREGSWFTYVRFVNSDDPRLLSLIEIWPRKILTRQRHVLENNNIQNLYDVILSSPAELKRIPGVGKATLKMLNACLERYGLWYIEKQTKLFDSTTQTISVR